MAEKYFQIQCKLNSDKWIVTEMQVHLWGLWLSGHPDLHCINGMIYHHNKLFIVFIKLYYYFKYMESIHLYISSLWVLLQRSFYLLRVMVLDAGVLKEFDSPTNLLKNPHSVFYSMAQDANLVWPTRHLKDKE